MAEVRRSFAYPTNHLLGVIDDAADAAEAARALVRAGFAAADVTLLRGTEGADRLDGLGEIGGPWRRVVRIFQFMSMDQMPDFRTYEAAVRDGRAIVAVRVRDRSAVLRARDILVGAGAHFINHFGRLSTEEFSRWRGVELPSAEYLRR
jgi:hypothetical protein